MMNRMKMVLVVAVVMGVGVAWGQLPGMRPVGRAQVELTPREQVVYEVARLDAQIEALQAKRAELIGVLAADDAGTTATLEGGNSK